MTAGPELRDVLAVLLALAGPRGGDPVCVEAPDHPLADRLAAGLLAASRTREQARHGALVCVAGGSADLPRALRRTADGGKVVCLAEDRREAQHDVALHDLLLVHTETLADGRLAWAGRLTGGTRLPS